MGIVKKYWHWILVGLIFFGEAIILFAFRENIYVGICDNLDLFIAQLKMLKDEQAFFSKDCVMPILKGIDRDYFPTEYSLYNLLYYLLPDVYAYISGYLLKIILAFVSCLLLAKEVLKETYKKNEVIVVLVSMAFALLPVYPMYALCFSSMPLILYLLIKVYRKPSFGCYVAIFVYPFVSYFTFFGAFILGYILIASIWVWIRDKSAPRSLWGAFLVLMLGYVCFEYRLFGIMLFSQEETIRSTMVIASFGWKELINCFVQAFLHGCSHANAVHTYLVLPVCMIYCVIHNGKYIKERKYREIGTDLFNISMLMIVFNCVVYALYYWEPLRRLVEIILPPLKGFQYGRTLFFNTFVWYFAFFIAIKHLYMRYKKIACCVCVGAIMIIGVTQAEYTDFYNTCYYNAYKMIKEKPVNQLSYGEFYGVDLFEIIKEDIQYEKEQMACAYGIHPSVLSYNGISTIDGYCGYYSQAYKEQFREVIEPTLAIVPRWKTYYDDWACRAYLFSANGNSNYDFGANSNAEPQELLVNSNKLKQLGCSYIFSRVEITNSDANNMELKSVYEVESVPYKIYLYELQ